MVVFIQGRPGCGKTTLVKRVLEKLNPSEADYTGFFTEEIREKGIRKGFKIITTSGEEAILADVDSKSPYRVSKYGVEIENIEKVAIPALGGKGLIVIDEIGKMELKSREFKRALKEAFEKNRNILATIPIYRLDFVNDLISKYRPVILKLNRKNSERILKETLKSIKDLTFAKLNHKGDKL